MTDAEYRKWRDTSNASRRAAILRGLRDPIYILGIPTGSLSDGHRHIEGFVVKSDTAEYPKGYVSLAWRAEAFELVEGDFVFTLVT